MRSPALPKIDVILLSGGKGTRLHTVTKDLIPKSLLEINGRKLIQYTLDALSPQQVGRVIFAVDHKSEDIRAWVNAQRFKFEVIFSEQTTPGVTGAVDAALTYVDSETFAICNTDEVRDNFNLNELVSFHNERRAVATMPVAFSGNLSRHRVVITDEAGVILKSRLKPDNYKESPLHQEWINVGFILFDKKAIGYFESTTSQDWSGIIDPLIHEKKMLALKQPALKYFNVGTLSELGEAESYFSKTKTTK